MSYHTRPALWVASERRELIDNGLDHSVNGRSRVPAGLIHAVEHETKADAETTLCGQSLDGLVRFPRSDFHGIASRKSTTSWICAACAGETNVALACRLLLFTPALIVVDWKAKE